MDRRSRLQPPLSSGLPRQECRIEQNGSRDNAIFQCVDIPFRATTCGRDFFHRPSVVAFAVYHHVAVHGVKMTVNDGVIRTRILVLIGGACRTHGTESALQDVRCARRREKSSAVLESGDGWIPGAFAPPAKSLISQPDFNHSHHRARVSNRKAAFQLGEIRSAASVSEPCRTMSSRSHSIVEAFQWNACVIHRYIFTSGAWEESP
jgi:hypothetical protein